MKQPKCIQQKVNDKLLADGYITKAQHKRLIIRDGKVYDDTRCNWSIADNGDVSVTESGPYPFLLKHYSLDLE